MKKNDHVLVKESTDSDFLSSGKVLSFSIEKKEALVLLFTDFKQPNCQLNNEIVLNEMRTKWVHLDLIKKLKPLNQVEFKINSMNTETLAYGISEAYSTAGDDNDTIQQKNNFIDKHEGDLKSRIALIKNQNLPHWESSQNKKQVNQQQL